MKKRSLLKRISGIVLCVLIVISALPIFPVTAKAVTLAEIPEKDWTGYTPVSTKEELAAIKNNPYGNYYLTCDINFTWQDFAEGGAFYNNNEGWVPIGRGFTKVPSAITSQSQFNSAREKYGELYLRQAESYDYIPLDISSVNSDTLFGANIARIEHNAESVNATIINVLYPFNSFTNLFTACLKSFGFSPGAFLLPGPKRFIGGVAILLFFFCIF